MSHQADMSHTSPPKRPRLSLQIKTPSAPMTLNESSTALKADIDPPSPTAFNTLSNAYAVAISPASPLPMSAAPTTTASFSANTARPKSLRLVASAAPQRAPSISLHPDTGSLYSCLPRYPDDAGSHACYGSPGCSATGAIYIQASAVCAPLFAFIYIIYRHQRHDSNSLPRPPHQRLHTHHPRTISFPLVTTHTPPSNNGIFNAI
ncbi:hypothetical protein GMDG_05545 [Pseudogymnoascus destructans 20631-21]|uniref:Uncharacterized protein n=1 Tax=Pseudogymnoascus destructans (strain ATCC MYA-4855 / 20631-21) TaxID=658429 RepID=L8FPZ3_PSED2|nr:hypothetical protein GMDG_05545 [Pseudogymnoascus destructans 20631-21]